MRVLVTYGTKRGGTEGIARQIHRTLVGNGFEAELRRACELHDVSTFDFDAVVVGGALYANLWHKDARRFVKRNAAELRRLPVWFFSSGPLDESAARGEIPPVKQVVHLMEQVSARGHKTFGGRLAPDAKGFIASRMAKTHAGDWRDGDQIRRWAVAIARELRPGEGVGAPAELEGHAP